MDFEISYNGDNELGSLCVAFNEMKGALEESLVSQWRLEQVRHEEMEALAHDLKTPFSLIQAYAEALLEWETLAEKEEHYLKVITENARRGAGMVRELLYAIELEVMSLDLTKESVNVPTYLRQKQASYWALAAQKGMDFQVRVAESGNVDLIVELDLTKLDRILDNILSNSFRYTPEGGVIELAAQIGDQWVEFTVCDTGKGFSSEESVHLFDKFYRGDAARTSGTGGSGLGLYTVKGLVEQQGGTIRAFNGVNGGACIQFALPRW